MTTLSSVKIIARIPDKVQEGAPTTATVGKLGDILLDSVTGFHYILNNINLTNYAWVQDTSLDLIIGMGIDKATADYTSISNDKTVDVASDNAIYTISEMVCYNLGLGDYEGRGRTSEALNGRSIAYEAKIYGYPRSIVGNIKRVITAL